MTTLSHTSIQKPIPRLVRPEKDGEVGAWSYHFEFNGQEYIFPALVNELGSLVDRRKHGEPRSDQAKEPSTEIPVATKVIYWRASEWETKLLPKAIEWTRKHGFAFPNVPFPIMELRKIEDRDGNDRVTEVVRYISFQPSGPIDYGDRECLMIDHFKEVEGEYGPTGKPLLQWWSDGLVDFGDELQDRMLSVSNCCETIGDWGQTPGFLERVIEQQGNLQDAFDLFAFRKSKKTAVTTETLRLATIWIAFCCYITSLKTTYEEGLPTRGRRKAEAKCLEEAIALEQSEIFRTVGILKSGKQRRPMATGTGTKHQYRYLVRGHERIVNGKVIWIKPQIRGEGDFIARSVGTDEAYDVAKQMEAPSDRPTVAFPKKHRKRLLERMLDLIGRWFTRSAA